MPKYLSFFAAFLFFCFGQYASAQWQTYNIGFDDNLTGIVVQDAKVLVSGHNGIYYSTKGINSDDWKKLSLVGSEYSLSFSRTKFTHCFSYLVSGKNQAFACGYDTISQKAVLYYINMQNWAVKRIYHGKRNTVINKICFSTGLGKYLGVGSGGLILSFDSTGYEVIECPYKDNLLSVSSATDAYGTDLTILSKDYLIQDDVKKDVHTFSIIPGFDKNLNDAFYISSTSIYLVGNLYQGFSGSYIYDIGNFDTDSLKANCIINFGNYNFIGTEHGVYRSGKNNYSYLEYQPSSLNANVNSFLNLGSGLVATCNHGRLIYTENYGGSTKLFVKLRGQGSCLNEEANVYANFGSATTCAWYVDGINVSNSCKTYSQTFKNSKAYDIKFIAKNDSGYRDTSIIQYHVVNPPNNKIKFTFSDSILCKEGHVDVTLDSTEANTYYVLNKKGTSIGGAVYGTGSSAKFKSGKLTETGAYLIEAKSTLAICYRTLKHNINVKVEKTEAKIYAHSLNVPMNDTALFFSHSMNAKYYQWRFDPKPLWFNDSTARTAAVFNKEGEVKATLVSWSDNGCIDSTSSMFTNVYDPNYIDSDSCWNLKIHGIDKEYLKHDVNSMIPLQNGGFIVDGTSPMKPSYESRKGKSLEVSSPDDG